MNGKQITVLDLDAVLRTSGYRVHYYYRGVANERREVWDDQVVGLIEPTLDKRGVPELLVFLGGRLDD